MNEASECERQGKGRPVRLAGNRCQTGTCVFNVSSATSFLETQSASAGAGKLLPHTLPRSAYDLLFAGMWRVKTKRTKNKRRTRSLVDLERRLCGVSWGSVGTASVFSSCFLHMGKNIDPAQMSIKENVWKDLQQPQKDAFLTWPQATVVNFHYRKRTGQATMNEQRGKWCTCTNRNCVTIQITLFDWQLISEMRKHHSNKPKPYLYIRLYREIVLQGWLKICSIVSVLVSLEMQKNLLHIQDQSTVMWEMFISLTTLKAQTQSPKQ